MTDFVTMHTSQAIILMGDTIGIGYQFIVGQSLSSNNAMPHHVTFCKYKRGRVGLINHKHPGDLWRHGGEGGLLPFAQIHDHNYAAEARYKCMIVELL